VRSGEAQTRNSRQTVSYLVSFDCAQDRSRGLYLMYSFHSGGLFLFQCVLSA